jgi:hypothetical protein
LRSLGCGLPLNDNSLATAVEALFEAGQMDFNEAT